MLIRLMFHVLQPLRVLKVPLPLKVIDKNNQAVIGRGYDNLYYMTKLIEEYNNWG